MNEERARQLARQLLAAHPDRGGAPEAFRRVKEAFDAARRLAAAR